MSLLQRLSDMATFAKVVESRSFTQAAVALDMSKGAVSKAISRLEQHLNVRLLVVSPDPSGFPNKQNTNAFQPLYSRYNRHWPKQG